LEARTLADPQPQRPKAKLVALTRAEDLVWLDTVARYREAGVVNEELLELMTQQLDWHAYFIQKPFYNFSKSLFDRTVATVALVVFSPILAACAIAVLLTSRGGAFYTQYRLGQNCQPFKIYKFRTMYAGSRRTYLMGRNEMQGGLFKIKRDPRITPIGRILRRWSIDEVPQLLNIIKGDMSLVGPRPLPPEDTSTVPRDAYLRFAVKPGLTGLWQATIRDSQDGFQKITLDAVYASQRSWKLDAWLLWRTIFTIVRGIGAW
jgi:lipopolysaccharide/colanic/teichoic acid biosynthesis glycosyltransferase